MKKICMLVLSVFTLIMNVQSMEKVNDAVVRLFVASDNREWNIVESIFADEVLLDYSSMNGQPAVTLSPQEITTSWKSILPGFESTHHQLGNFITTVDGNTAEVFCYGTATHYLPHEKGNVWTVVGTYNLKLTKVKDAWRVSAMKFNFKYMDGNTALPQAAMDKVKENK